MTNKIRQYYHLINIVLSSGMCIYLVTSTLSAKEVNILAPRTKI